MSQATLQHHAPPSPERAIRRPRVALPFAAIVLAMLPAVLDQTILATALPVVAGDLGRLTDVSWVVTAYVVAAAATTPLWGKLGDRIGRKLPARGRAARLRPRLGAVRRGAGHHAADRPARRPGRRRRRPDDAGDGRRRRPRRAARARPLPGLHRRHLRRRRPSSARCIGGVLVDHASWRWVFLVNLPIGAAALAGLHLRLPAPEAAGADRPLDVAGAALLAGATTALMLTCIWGGSRYAWDSAAILALIAATVVLSGALVVRERRAADPIVPFHLLRTGPGGHRQRRAVPRDRRAVLGHRLRPALPGDDDRGEPDRGRAAAGAGHARHRRLDDALRPQHRAHRALQALPDRRAGAHDRGARPARRRSPATRRRSPPVSPSPCSASASAWSRRS